MLRVVMRERRNVIFSLDDSRVEQLLRHIVDNWHLRKTAIAQATVIPEMIVDGGSALVEHISKDVNFKLADHTRGLLVLSKRFCWGYTSSVTFSSARVEVDRIVPIRIDIVDAARRLCDGAVYGMMVLTGTVLCLPAGPEIDDDLELRRAAVLASPQSNVGYSRLHDLCGPDASRPDTSQPYPLDDLLTEIANLTQ